MLKREKKRRKVSHTGTTPLGESGHINKESSFVASKTSSEVPPIEPSLGMTRDVPQTKMGVVVHPVRAISSTTLEGKGAQLGIELPLKMPMT